MTPSLVVASHTRLLRTLDGLDDESSAAASALPGWTRGHVATHLARNADSNTWMLDGVMAGEQREQYPGGRATRAAAIEAGATRSAAEILEDVALSARRLAAAYDRVHADDWDQPVGATRGAIPASELAWSRLREVEVHHADLGLGYGPADWPAAFVAGELARRAPEAGDRLPLGTALRIVATDGAGVWEIGEGPASLSVSGPGCWLLAWLLGRRVPTRVLHAPAGLPALGDW